MIDVLITILAVFSPFILGIIIYYTYISYREKQILKYGKKYEASIAVVQPSFGSNAPDVYYEFIYNDKKIMLPYYNRTKSDYYYKGTAYIYYYPKFPDGVIADNR